MGADDKTGTQPSMPAVRQQEHETERLSREEIQAQLLKKLQSTLEQGLGEIRDDVAAARTDIATLDNGVTVLRERVILVERRMDGYDGRLNTQSERVRGESHTNLEQDGAIAATRTDVADIKSEVSNITTEQAEHKAMLEKHGAMLTALTATKAEDEKWRAEMRAGFQAAMKHFPWQAVMMACGALVLAMLGAATTYFSVRGH